MLGILTGILAVFVSVLMGYSGWILLGCYVVGGTVGLVTSAVVAYVWRGELWGSDPSRCRPDSDKVQLPFQAVCKELGILSEQGRELVPSGTAPALPSLQGRRILVVEDELLLFDEMREELEAQGAKVLGPAPNVSAALQLLSTDAPPDVAILDINLGGQMVYPVADALQHRGIPFVFATGYTSRIVPQTFAGALLFEKPVNMRGLMQALRGGRDQLQPVMA
jgi:CheY-like chemotaxis protein